MLKGVILGSGFHIRVRVRIIGNNQDEQLLNNFCSDGRRDFLVGSVPTNPGTAVPTEPNTTFLPQREVPEITSLPCTWLYLQNGTSH